MARQPPRKDFELVLADGGVLARRASGFLPDGAFWFEDTLDIQGKLLAPMLLGAGIPLFHALPRQVDLKLVEAQTFKNGCVALTYRVKHRKA